MAGLLALGMLALYLLPRQQTRGTQTAEPTASQQPDTTGPAVAPEFMFPGDAERGGIEGRVIDTQGTGVPDAVVSIVPKLVGRDRFGDWFKKASPRLVRTDKDGRYQVDDVAPELLSLSATARQLLPGRRDRVQLMPGERLTGVDIKVEKGGSRLFGSVSDSGGGPIVGATIVLAGFDKTESFDEQSTLFVLQTQSDGNGNYEIFVAPSWYDLTVTANGYAPEQSWVNVHKWDDGTPAGNVRVVSFSKGSGGQSTTDASGSFKIEKLGPDDYTVMAQNEADEMWGNREPDARSIRKLKLGKGEQVKDVVLQLRRTNLTIEGIVMGPGNKPIAGAQVGATEGRTARFGGCSFAYQGKFTSDGDGHFKIENLSSGVYGVCAAAPGYPEGTALNVTAGSRGVQIRLRQPGRISGIVVDTEGQPVKAATVFAAARQPENNKDVLAELKSRPNRAETKAGAFELSGLKPAVWDVLAETPEGQRGIARGVVIDEGTEIVGFRIVLETGVTVSGQVLNAETGKPIAGVAVHSGTYALTGDDTGGKNVTDGQGRYRVANATRGMKVAIFFAPPHDSPILPDELEAWVPADAKDMNLGVFHLTPGKLEDIWMPGPRIGLRVRHEGGSPVVTGIFEESPAAKSGIQVRDRVLSIDGKSIANLGKASIDRLLTGEEGKTATVRVQTGNDAPRDVVIPFQAF